MPDEDELHTALGLFVIARGAYRERLQAFARELDPLSDVAQQDGQELRSGVRNLVSQHRPEILHQFDEALRTIHNAEAASLNIFHRAASVTNCANGEIGLQLGTAGSNIRSFEIEDEGIVRPAERPPREIAVSEIRRHTDTYETARRNLHDLSEYGGG